MTQDWSSPCMGGSTAPLLQRTSLAQDQPTTDGFYCQLIAVSQLHIQLIIVDYNCFKINPVQTTARSWVLNRTNNTQEKVKYHPVLHICFSLNIHISGYYLYFFSELILVPRLHSRTLFLQKSVTNTPKTNWAAQLMSCLGFAYKQYFIFFGICTALVVMCQFALPHCSERLSGSKSVSLI